MAHKAWTAEDQELLRRQFPIEKTGDVAITLGRTKAAVSRRARLLGLCKSDGRWERIQTHYSVRQDVFDQLDASSAYALGLIVADGSLRGDRLKVSNNNLDLMQEVRRTLGSNHRIRAPKDPRDSCYEFTVQNQQIARALRSWGVIENKSLIGTWPQRLPDDMFGHVLRGYFDGDGHVNYGHRSGLRLKFTSGSAGLLCGLAAELTERFDIPPAAVRADKGRPNANRLWYYGRNATRIGEIMYAAGGFFIAAKRAPFVAYENRLS